MSFDFRTSNLRPSHAQGILFVGLAVLPVAVGLHLLAGPIVALGACALFAAALILTLVAQREAEPSSLDADTGLPDRAAAILRLEGMVAQRAAARRQAGVVIAAFPEQAFADAEDRRSALLLAALRMAQRLRKGDQILRVGTSSLAVILGPSRGLNARSARDILDRLDGVLREPLRIGERVLDVEAALGVCLQHDAPAQDARAWLDAAEDAAEVAALKGEPHVYWLALAPQPARWHEPENRGVEPLPDKDARSA